MILLFIKIQSGGENRLVLLILLFFVWFNPTLTILKLVNTISTTNITIGNINIRF